MVRQPRIVILGSGFGGVEAARALVKLLRKQKDAQIVLVDQNNFLLYTPMLVEVVAGLVDMLHIVTPVRRVHPRLMVVQARIESIDLQNKLVCLYTSGKGFGDPPVRYSLEADQLIIALGSVPNFYGIPGLRENAITMKNLCDAVGLHNRVLALLERANIETDPAIRSSLLTFIVGGGGFSGVETAGAINDTIRDTLKYYPNIHLSEVRVIVIEALGHLLPELDSDLGEYAHRHLVRQGVDIMLNTKVERATPTELYIGGDRCLNAHTIIWTGGISPVAVVRNLPCEHSKHGAIVTDTTCAVPGYPGVWAIGDCAAIPQPGQQRPYAPTAQNATREGKLVAGNVVATLHEQSAKSFAYRPIGEAALLGRRTGIASFFGIHISGFVGWFLWRAIYLVKLPHIMQRVRVGLDWMVDLIFGREIVEVPSQCYVAGICPAIEEMQSQVKSNL